MNYFTSTVLNRNTYFYYIINSLRQCFGKELQNF